ncbi:SAM-dependent methyltransferase [Salinisphaera hydrothermalis]|uniref:Type 11 methyltransferase n=1 Tax=Salinisphaera hydrothermalis (strain C41B8) TaxID=1304275 RepID=A0A084ILN1_SALHC|nr:cyclopropane-fatty-acyl-phospholipid synthase family protein [Salinisphaera hydrothermalis]KEZ77615.1 type 11 methyltransferase [Salinisphaera hydrothermalis C41B8]
MDSLPIEACERGLVPDFIARAGMRRLIGQRLATPEAKNADKRNEAMRAFLERANSGPIAQHTADANAQHYELPPAFFEQVLGAHLKYSGCLFESGIDDLDTAEHAMLALTADRARIRDGQRILDLGCGWGSFSLWAARRFPHAQVRAVSNSSTQREWIEARAAERELDNLTVETCDINRFDPGEKQFDRIVSIEMFEHMRNYRELFSRCARWLDDHGRLFVHVFAHKHLAYRFTNDSANDWMARYFFTGGVMPSQSLFAHFQRDLLLRDSWWVSGTHYRDTANAWLARMDDKRDAVMAVMRETYGEADAERWFNRWRMFFMAVAELFGYGGGNEWGVGHYLFTPRRALDDVRT